MKSRIEKHKLGYNCSQAIICTYCDLLGMDEETASRASGGFGSGMATMEGTCGAVTEMFMLAGLKNSNGLVDIGTTKSSTYALVNKLSE